MSSKGEVSATEYKQNIIKKYTYSEATQNSDERSGHQCAMKRRGAEAYRTTLQHNKKKLS